MSEKELFPTDHFEYISIRLVHSKKCSVYTFDDYEKLTEIPPEAYFSRYPWLSRSTYKVNKCDLAPHPNEWPKHCVCNFPLNPDDNYIQCEACHKWFHYTCVSLSPEQADNLEQYFCSKCRDKPANGAHAPK